MKKVILMSVVVLALGSAFGQDDAGYSREDHWANLLSVYSSRPDENTQQQKYDRILIFNQLVNSYQKRLIEDYRNTDEVDPDLAAMQLDTLFTHSADLLEEAGELDAADGILGFAYRYNKGTSYESNRVMDRAWLFINSDPTRAIGIMEAHVLRPDILTGSAKKQNFDADICFFLASSYAKTGDPAAAIIQYEKMFDWAMGNSYATQGSLRNAWSKYTTLLDQNTQMNRYSGSELAQIEQSLNNLPEKSTSTVEQTKLDWEADSAAYGANFDDLYGFH